MSNEDLDIVNRVIMTESNVKKRYYNILDKYEVSNFKNEIYQKGVL